MKKTTLLTLLATALLATPDWYSKLSPSVPTELIGYGEGSTLEEAKASAKSDIAHAIYSHISSSVSSNTQVSGKDVKSSATHSMEDRSDVVLSETKLLKSEHEISSNRWFVALSFDNRPFEEKLYAKSGKAICSTTLHPYLSSTAFVQKMTSRANCAKGASFQITRENGIWYGGINEARVPMGNSVIGELMQKLSSGTFSMGVEGGQTFIKDGEGFKLLLTSLPKSGYLSLFDLYNDGRVVAMEANINLANHSKTVITYPDNLRPDFELVGGLLKTGEETRDLFVAVVSPKPLDLSHFPRMGMEVNRDELSFGFDRLLELMKNSPFATALVTTRAKWLK